MLFEIENRVRFLFGSAESDQRTRSKTAFLQQEVRTQRLDTWQCKKSFFKQFWRCLSAISLRPPKHPTNLYICVCVFYRTPLGRARAWLRLALMQKRLADYLRLLITRKDLLRYIQICTHGKICSFRCLISLLKMTSYIYKFWDISRSVCQNIFVCIYSKLY